MLKIFGSELCPDCIQCKMNLDAYSIDYEFVDICKDLKDMKAFLACRDTDAVFAPCKEANTIGIPALLTEKGITLDWEGYLQDLGKTVIPFEGTSQACSIDGKGC